MYLKSVSLKGFKSFAKKTELNFEPGITMIVGPNGSGKSNITDAVQWVLGEQSAKALRGSKMQDVIFSGSLNHKPLGLAEITLTIDNSKNDLGLDFSEVTITRRILRNGENYYFINSTPCRLLDIYDLLNDGGLGKDTHSIIGQGKLEEVINSKPEEKRVLLEEAAGVLKHKKRKERAQRKLVSTEDNIERANDILSEVKKQIKPLELQMNKAKTHKALKEKLRELEIGLLVNKITKIKTRWEKLQEEEKNAKLKINPLKENIAQLSSSISKKEKEYQDQANMVAQKQRLKDGLSSACASLERILSLIKEKDQSSALNSVEAKDQIARDEEHLNLKQAQHENLKRQLENVQTEITRNLKAIAHRRKEGEEIIPNYANITNEIEDLVVKLENLNNEIASKEKDVQAKKNEIEFIGRGLGEQKKSIETNENEAKKRRQEIFEIDKSLTGQKEKLDKVNEVIHGKTKEKLRLNSELENINIEIGGIEKEISRLEGQLSLQNNIVSDLKPNDILNDEGGKGLITTSLEKILMVRKKHLKAIESYLGSVIGGLVVRSEEDAKKLLANSKKEKRRINILIADNELETKSPVDPFSDKAPGWLKEVFKNVEIVKNLSKIPKNQIDSKIYVTYDGEIFQKGIIKADYRDGNRGLLSIQEQIAKCRSTIKELENKHANSLDKKEHLIKSILSVETCLEDSNKNLNKENETCAKLKTEKEIAVQAQNRLVAETKSAGLQINSYESKKIELLASIETNNKDINDFKSETQNFEERIKNLEKKHKKFFDEKQSQKNAITELNYVARNLNHQQLSLKNQLQETNNEINELTNHHKKHLLKLSTCEEARIKINRIQPLVQAIVEISSGRKASFDKQNEDSNIIDDLKKKREEERALKEELSFLEEKNQKLAIEKSALKSSLDSFADRIIEEHNIAVENAINEYSQIETSSALVSSIKDELNKIGPVNAVAQNEFESLSERKSFLDKQIEDLLKGKISIKKIIRAIDKKIKNRLVETFTLVNNDFKQTFSKLFPGGEAELVLTGDDVCDGGLDVKAQPYGKELKKLSLLSGGETALTALALLFAVYHTRPSLFYILDEVEAALDDINLQRFIRLLREMKTRTQFIVITHQRRTMEVADCLYGATMKADGVSRVISQKMNKVETKDEPIKQEVSAS